MKNFILIFAALFICADSFAQTQWTNVSYADDDLEGHKLDIVLPDTNQPSYKAVVLTS